MIANRPARSSSGLSTPRPGTGVIAPRTRIVGGAPAVRCRSEPPCSATISKSSSSSSSGVGTANACATGSAHDTKYLLDGCPALLHLQPAVLAQGGHPLRTGDLVDLLGRRTGHRESLDLLAHRHHLVQRHPAAVAGVRARRAAHRAVEVV